MSSLTRDGTAEPVSRDQILRHVRGQGNTHFPCSADHEQDWQPYPVGPYSAMCDDHMYTAKISRETIAANRNYSYYYQDRARLLYGWLELIGCSFVPPSDKQFHFMEVA